MRGRCGRAVTCPCYNGDIWVTRALPVKVSSLCGGRIRKCDSRKAGMSFRPHRNRRRCWRASERHMPASGSVRFPHTPGRVCGAGGSREVPVFATGVPPGRRTLLQLINQIVNNHPMNSTSDKPASRGRPPHSRGGDTRQCILDNALELFAEQGISETSIAQIAHASGVTSAMVHYYFHNREGLLDALVVECLLPRVQYIWSCVNNADALQNPQQLVTDIITHILKIVDEIPKFPQLWNREIFHINGRLRERFVQHIPLENIARLHDALCEAQRKGLLNQQISPELLFISAISLIMVPLSAQIYLHDVDGFPIFEKERIGKHALALILNGILPEKGK